jgi:hypothetical protein
MLEELVIFYIKDIRLELQIDHGIQKIVIPYNLL